MIEALAEAESEEDPPPTSPVASHEVIMDSPENAPDPAEEDLAQSTPLPVQESPSLENEGEEPPPGLHRVADMPPPALEPAALAIQDVPQYVQERLAEAAAAAGVSAPEEADSDWRLRNNS